MIDLLESQGAELRVLVYGRADHDLLPSQVQQPLKNVRFSFRKALTFHSERIARMAGRPMPVWPQLPRSNGSIGAAGCALLLRLRDGADPDTDGTAHTQTGRLLVEIRQALPEAAALRLPPD